MNLEGFELPEFIEIDCDPLPILFPLLLSTANCVLDNCNPRPAKAHVLLGRVACGPLGDPLLSCGGRPSDDNILNFSVRVSAGVVLGLGILIIDILI
jgi:hypothetical protein